MQAVIAPHLKKGKTPDIKFPWDDEANKTQPLTKQQSVDFWNKVDKKQQ